MVGRHQILMPFKNKKKKEIKSKCVFQLKAPCQKEILLFKPWDEFAV